MADSIQTGAQIVSIELEKFKPRLSTRLAETFAQRFLTADEIAEIAAEEAGIAMTNLILGLRNSIEEVVRTSR